MPPALLLKGDDKFYGKIKPTGFTGQSPLEHPAPPPNPMSNVALTNELQRKEATARITKDLETPENLKSIELPSTSAELGRKDVAILNDSNDIGSRFVRFLRTPIVEVSKETEKQQEKREVDRIVGETNEPITNVVRPVGEVPLAIGDFIENKFMKAVLFLSAVYLGGQFLSGYARSSSKSTKKDD